MFMQGVSVSPPERMEEKPQERSRTGARREDSFKKEDLAQNCLAGESDEQNAEPHPPRLP